MSLSHVLLIASILACFLSGSSCKKSNKLTFSNEIVEVPDNDPVPQYDQIELSTDKAIYKPGEQVNISIAGIDNIQGVKVRYKHQNEILSEENINALQWGWQPPDVDFTGYLVEVINTDNNETTICGTIGVDVSSSWTKFPRYGFLSKFPALQATSVNEVIDNLNRFHINGLQFYDWHYKHHQPLPFVGGQPAEEWKDIINRDIHLSTVQNYITVAHNRGMKAMFYNLLYGAWGDAADDGVNDDWYIFKDVNGLNKDSHELPKPPFVSDIFLTNPANEEWQSYLLNEHDKVYNSLDFDGFHIDQLGDRGSRYLADGKGINLSATYAPFIEACKNRQPDKYLVMNAVNQYGQSNITFSPVDFLYTEVWSPNDTYNDLSNIIKNNYEFSQGKKNTVLAAYMNYDLADDKGFFHQPSVLTTNAVIFAFGGAHLELGEHMLGKEYFPNNNLEVTEELNKRLIDYYDFLVAYQNLLRDKGQFNTVKLESLSNQSNVLNWPASAGSIACIAKLVEDRQVIHLINFNELAQLDWRDNNGEHKTPRIIEDLKLELSSGKTVKSVWCASPDVAGGTSIQLNHIQEEHTVRFKLPKLEYWSMIVLEFN